jgi:hypothetical protein
MTGELTSMNTSDNIVCQREDTPLSPLEFIEADLVSLIPEVHDLEELLSNPIATTERALSVIDEAEQMLLRMVDSVRKIRESPYLQE